MQKTKTFFMFDGQAEEAMNFYISLFDRSEIINIQRYGKDEAGPEGSVIQAGFTLNGVEYMCIDSPVKHQFNFTPAISIFVICETEEEIDRLFAKLSEGGNVFMPLTSYPFSERFGWTSDRFGVSWQLNLVKPGQ
jgi:predicted 3-demethylubiquinone-9 3-methyltransferase (glyoxalase superfamily)